MNIQTTNKIKNRLIFTRKKKQQLKNYHQIDTFKQYYILWLPANLWF